MTNRIVIPFGKPVMRIQVDIDEKGQVQINGHKRGPIANTVLMTMFEVTSILANVVASNLMAMGGALPYQAKEQQHAIPVEGGGGDGPKTAS